MMGQKTAALVVAALCFLLAAAQFLLRRKIDAQSVRLSATLYLLAGLMFLLLSMG